jgi:hypothetical protein
MKRRGCACREFPRSEYRNPEKNRESLLRCSFFDLIRRTPGYAGAAVAVQHFLASRPGSFCLSILQ